MTTVSVSSLLDHLGDSGLADQQNEQGDDCGRRQQGDDRAGAKKADAERDQRAGAGLQEAHQSRGAAGIAGEGRKAEGGGVGVRQADAGEEEEEQHQRAGEADDVAAHPEEEDDADGDLREQRAVEDLLTVEVAEQQDVDLIAADEAHDQHGEDDAEGLGAHVEAVHEDDGRAGDEGEETGEGEGSGEAVGDELRDLEDVPVAGEDGAGAERDGVVGLVAFGQKEEDEGEDDEGDRRQQGEDPLPAEAGHDGAADGGGEQGRDADHEEEHGEHAGALLGGEEVAHHGDGADLGDAAAEGLEEAQGDEGAEVGREGAADGGQDIDGQAEVERALAAEAVEKGTVEDLAEREADEVGGERQRDGRAVGVIGCGDLRERGQVHVDGEGSDDAKGPKQQCDPGEVMFVRLHAGEELLLFEFSKFRVGRVRLRASADVDRRKKALAEW